MYDSIVLVDLRSDSLARSRLPAKGPLAKLGAVGRHFTDHRIVVGVFASFKHPPIFYSDETAFLPVTTVR